MTRRITTVALALVMALIGTVLVVVYVGRADARALKGVESISVLVATGPLTKGQTVRQAQDSKLIATQRLPRKAVPTDALTKLAAADASLVFASDVTKGEILLRHRLVPAEAVNPKGGLLIPEGRLAVSVQLDDPARVASFVHAGSEIAVFASFNVFEGNEGATWTPSGDHLSDEFLKNKATRVLLGRVKVLAVGATTSVQSTPAEEEGTSKPQSAAAVKSLTLVTLAVTQREAEKLVHAVQTGTLYFGLLSTYQVKPGPGVDNRRLFDGQPAR